MTILPPKSVIRHFLRQKLDELEQFIWKINKRPSPSNNHPPQNNNQSQRWTLAAGTLPTHLVISTMQRCNESIRQSDTNKSVRSPKFTNHNFTMLNACSTARCFICWYCTCWYRQDCLSSILLRHNSTATLSLFFRLLEQFGQLGCSSCCYN